MGFEDDVPVQMRRDISTASGEDVKSTFHAKNSPALHNLYQSCTMDTMISSRVSGKFNDNMEWPQQIYGQQNYQSMRMHHGEMSSGQVMDHGAPSASRYAAPNCKCILLIAHQPTLAAVS